jgi:hypothetical protein
LRFIVLPTAVGIEVALEVFNQGKYGLRNGHGLRFQVGN